MNEIVNKKTRIRFFENVCSRRTNLGLIQNLMNEDLCKRGVEYYD